MKELLIKITDSYYEKAVNYDLDAPTEIVEAIRHGTETTSEDCVSREETVRTAIKALEQEPNWIPVSERMPEDLEPVNITWVNHNPASYYADIKDKPFTATGVYFNGQWYWWSTLCTDILAEYSHNYDDIIDDDIEITAWQPLPKPYKAESEE